MKNLEAIEREEQKPIFVREATEEELAWERAVQESAKRMSEDEEYRQKIAKDLF